MKFLDRYEVEFGRKTVIDLLASRQADYCPSNHTQRPYHYENQYLRKRP